MSDKPGQNSGTAWSLEEDCRLMRLRKLHSDLTWGQFHNMDFFPDRTSCGVMERYRKLERDMRICKTLSSDTPGTRAQINARKRARDLIAAAESSNTRPAKRSRPEGDQEDRLPSAPQQPLSPSAQRPHPLGPAASPIGYSAPFEPCDPVQSLHYSQQQTQPQAEAQRRLENEVARLREELWQVNRQVEEMRRLFNPASRKMLSICTDRIAAQEKENTVLAKEVGTLKGELKAMTRRLQEMEKEKITSGDALDS